MATTSDVSVGSILRYNGELCVVTEWQHRTPGNLRAFYQGKMRNIKSGKSAENRFRAGEEVEIARVEFKEMEYLYEDNGALICMDNETFDQVPVPKEYFGDGMSFMKEGDKVKVAFESDLPILGEPPTFVELMITYCEPGKKGDTATNTLKPATLETGAIVSVPLFVNEGEKIKVDTRTSSYVERVK
ncbi:MAG TPA: elongation factor P [Bacteroidia bacterium]|nr:elongation factor P [Bacteroidota bacterium]MBL0051158.1 elongation factor P [Bacteroidota bacterium]HRC33810.1 elongation factor P [Bacteroidia bacterium]